MHAPQVLPVGTSHGRESGFTTRVKPKTSEPLSGIMFDMDRDVNEFLEYVSTVTGEKC